MKKDLFISIFVLCLAILTGCEDDFDAKIYGSLSTTNFPSTEAEYEEYMMTAYVPFITSQVYQWDGCALQVGFWVPMTGMLRMMDSTTDECAPWTINTWGLSWQYLTECQFENLRFVDRSDMNTPTHFEKVRDITRMTEIIGTLEKADILSEEKKKEWLGEVRLLRGLTMYNLLHIYGPVPVILDPEKIGVFEEESKMERPTLDEMTNYITTDMEYAVHNIAEKQSEKGRYNRDYARFCLMRHYLNEGAHTPGYYQKAYELYSQFTGGYSLYKEGSNPYAEQFKVGHKFNCETIMAVSCSSTADGSGAQGNCNLNYQYMVPWDATKYTNTGDPTPFEKGGGGWSQTMNISPAFYDTFEEGDKRKETIITYYYSSLTNNWNNLWNIGQTWNGYIINKYPAETETNIQGTDMPLARWADVLLMYAEADVRLNNKVSDAAIDCVNQVRNRAGLANLTYDKTASVEVFMDVLLTERGHELFYEGCRKIDLIRFNKYYSKLKAIGKTPSHQYFPLPDFAVNQAEEAGYYLAQYYTRPDYDGN